MKFKCRGSTLSIRVMGLANDRSMPFVLKERRKVYLPGLGIPESGSTLRKTLEVSGIWRRSISLRTIS